MNDTKVKMPKCWICKDEGVVFYYKKSNEIKYEFIARCKCLKGVNSGGAIPVISEEFAREMAEVNFKKFSKKHPELVKGQAG